MTIPKLFYSTYSIHRINYRSTHYTTIRYQRKRSYLYTHFTGRGIIQEIP